MDFWTSLQISIGDILLGDLNFERLCEDRYYFGEVDDAYKYPYVITYGEMSARPWMTIGNTTSGENLIWPFYVVCDLANGGAGKVREIMAVIDSKFHLKHFNLSDWEVVRCIKLNNVYPMKESVDSSVLRGSVSFRIMLERSDSM